jgi:fatty-acyl-CoA synthase
VGSWNYADVYEAAADQRPGDDCLVQGDIRRTWGEVDRRADGVARHLLGAGLDRRTAVALYLFNCPEYLESTFAAFKAALVPVNTNYRYTADELHYLWDNADAAAVVFHGTFTDTIAPIRSRLPRIRTWLWVDDGSGPCPGWATDYELVASAPSERVFPPWGRDGDDLLLLYTGGTTGMPKGVMWRQDDLVVNLSANLPKPFPDDQASVDLGAWFDKPGRRLLPACPLMHGTGCFSALGTLSGGGAVVLLTNRRFDPVEYLDTIEREQVQATAIVGDAFAKPILRALDADPGRWDLSSLAGMISSGVMWSEETKKGLLGHHPGMLLLDAFSSSEALGMGRSVSGSGELARTARFQLGEDAIVLDETNNPLPPGSPEIGRLAVGGRQPIGYYKDDEKTARTFLQIDGKRYSCPGDFATVTDDGAIDLLGRGSVCINTGGEKVFPEEVEEALKTHEAVADAVAIGVPDDDYGEAVTAVVEVVEGAALDEPAVIAHVKERLASYKAPRRVVVVDSIGRAPNGKVDYKQLKIQATSAQATSAQATSATDGRRPAWTATLPPDKE